MSDNESFLQRFIQAMATHTVQDDAAALCSEAWVRTTGAQRADIIQISTPDTLIMDTCERAAGGNCQHRRRRIPAHFSVLLDETGLQEAIADDAAATAGRLIPLELPGAAMRVTELAAAAPGTPQRIWRDALARASSDLLQTSSAERQTFPSPRHLEAMAEFAAGAGHEINNPLGSILGQTSLLLRDETRVERRQALETIGGQGWRIRDMIGNTMLFARPPVPKPETVRLADVVPRLVQALQEDSRYANAQFEQVLAPDEISLEADPTQLSSLLSYLLRNAAEELRNVNEPGTVTLTVTRPAGRDVIAISVQDSAGRAISDEERRHLFDPFYSGRSAGRGLGFGLSLAWQIVRNHGGLLFAWSPPEGGLQTHVALPARPVAADLGAASD